MGHKLCLGTAQFGLNYGITNNLGKVNLDEIKKIINVAHKSGIEYIDTAQSYGDAEFILGKTEFPLDNFSIISKFSPKPEKTWGKADIKIWEKDFQKSLKNLNTLMCYLAFPRGNITSFGVKIYSENQFSEGKK